MTVDLHREQQEALDAIERRRVEVQIQIATREELANASPSSLRALASSIRAGAWSDRSVSAEELADFSDDPGWAPSAAVRVAGLIDHLAELSYPTGTDLALSEILATTPPPAPAPIKAPWARLELNDLEERFAALENASDVWVHDVAGGGMPLLRACTWRGEVIEIVWFSAADKKRAILLAEQKKGGNDAKAVKGDLDRLKNQLATWPDALVRAGFVRPHFGPELTAEVFRRHVINRERLDVTVDVNAIANGLVHHIARIAPHVDFARSAVTDLEIQRLADNSTKKTVWRKACRALERLPVKGPAWRLLGMPDTTALLVARAEQGGDKAPGADALMAHNFEESLVHAHGIRSALLTSDAGAARTLAARLRSGAVWVGYVDVPRPEERYVSPILSWPTGTASESRYSTLAALIDELLVCGVSDHLSATDGHTTIELRSHLEQEHQYVADWHQPILFVRGFGVPRVRPPSGKWPLRVLKVGSSLNTSGARVTVEQAVTSLEWIRSSDVGQLSRENLPISGDAKNEAWNLLRAINLVDGDGRVIGHAMLSNAALHRDVEAIREMFLRFEPVAKVVQAVAGGAQTVAEAKAASDMSDRTFSSAAILAVAAGLLWRAGDALGVGFAFVAKEAFVEWLEKVAREPIRISELAAIATKELNLSPVRFETALAAIIDDPRLDGKRGGSAQSTPLDAKIITIDELGKIASAEHAVDNILGLRTLEMR